MASRKALLVGAAAAMAVVVVGALLPVTASAYGYKVGDDNVGWRPGVNYGWWASLKEPFYVGDTLDFVYPQGSHNVVWVSEGDYEACTVPNNAPTLNSGNDRVTLGGPGRFFFICGFAGHCQSGMKLALTVEP